MRKNVYLIIITLITVACIIAGSLYHISGFPGDLFGGFFSKNDSGSEKLFDDAMIDPSDITSIKVQAEVIDLTVERGDAFNIIYKGNEKLKPEVENRGGVITITQKTKAVHGLFGNRQNRISRSRLTVTIPDGLKLDLFYCSMNVGDLNLSGGEFLETDLTGNIGDIKAADCTLGSARIHIDTGDLSVKNCSFSALDISSDVGDVEVKTIDPTETYRLDLKTDLGGVEIDDREVGKSYVQDANGPDLRVQNDIGDIEVSQS